MQTFSLIDAIKLLAGVAFFLYGMKTMGSGLEKVSGSKLEGILEKVTNKPIKGLLTGTFVTAVIQSSSATVIMIIGFVNTGIMILANSVEVILGANIGTTITAWILSLSEIGNGEASDLLSLLKPENFSCIFAFIAIIMIMSKNRGKKHDVALILMGFAILMFGMYTMREAMAPLAEEEWFTRLLTTITNPILGLIIGIGITALMQSSSASIGVLQAMSISITTINASVAIPIILGAKVGQCVTPIIGAIGARPKAKRVAFIHLYFNLIGTLIALAVYLVLKYTGTINFDGWMMNPVIIAILHSLSSIVFTFILLPFKKFILRLTEITVPDNEEANEKPILDERLLETPAVALQLCIENTNRMAEIARENFKRSLDILTDYDDKIADKITETEEVIDGYEDVLGNYLVKLSSREMAERDSNRASNMLHTIGDFERIGDHAANLLKCAEELHEKKLSFTGEALRELTVAKAAMTDILNLTLDSFTKDDISMAKHVEPFEQVIDDLISEIRDRHIHRLQHGECTIELGFILTDIITNFERVSDHCSNIAACMIQVPGGGLSKHSYLNQIKTGESEEFIADFDSYKEKYII